MRPFVMQSQARQLLHNKFVVVLGDSVQCSMYKDLVLLLQRDQYLTLPQLKSKGELSFEQDVLVEGGQLGPMTNDTEYREVRQYRSDHHLLRFYFLTRIYSPYMESILEDFRQGLKPDVLVISSCLWDITSFAAPCLTWQQSKWTTGYKAEQRTSGPCCCRHSRPISMHRPLVTATKLDIQPWITRSSCPSADSRRRLQSAVFTLAALCSLVLLQVH